MFGANDDRWRILWINLLWPIISILAVLSFGNLAASSDSSTPMETTHTYTHTPSNDSEGRFQLAKDDAATRTNVSAAPSARLNLCCPTGKRLSNDTCVESNDTFYLPPLYDSDNWTRMIEEKPNVSDHFTAELYDPCKGEKKYTLNPQEEQDAYWLLENGSVYTTVSRILAENLYCLVPEKGNLYEVKVCWEDEDESDTHGIPVAYSVVMIISVPFLFATFIVYTVLPELKNIHGYTLRNYVACLFFGYVTLIVVQMYPLLESSRNDFCIAIAFIIYFSFMASFFWLNVMCFDIWWTFGGFRSLQGSVTQRERKKFIMYSVYAWGCASIFTATCAIMDFVPGIPDHFIKPKFGDRSCWFSYSDDKNSVMRDSARALYFYGPMGIIVVCNVCLFVSTALKIFKHKRDMAHQLRGVDSKRHDDNKQWFNLYLKLFIVMGINWSMEIISWLCKTSPQSIWYIPDFFNSLQGLTIFLIFVWKDNIRRLLAKRFGCHGRNFLSRASTTRSGCHSSAASRTCTTTGSVASSQEKTIPRFTDSSHNKSTCFK